MPMSTGRSSARPAKGGRCAVIALEQCGKIGVAATAGERVRREQPHPGVAGLALDQLGRGEGDRPPASGSAKPSATAASAAAP